MLTNGIILTISGRDIETSRHLVRPFTNSVHDTSTINGVVQEYIDHTVLTLGNLELSVTS